MVQAILQRTCSCPQGDFGFLACLSGPVGCGDGSIRGTEEILVRLNCAENRVGFQGPWVKGFWKCPWGTDLALELFVLNPALRFRVVL